MLYLDTAKGGFGTIFESIRDRTSTHSHRRVAMATRMRIRPCNRHWIEEDMRRVMTTRNNVKRLDAMIALPLARFRRALMELTPDELEALEAQITLQSVKSRWMRGTQGVARHRVAHDLGLLARRATEIRRERETRRGALTQLRLVESSATVHELTAPDRQDRAA